MSGAEKRNESVTSAQTTSDITAQLHMFRKGFPRLVPLHSKQPTGFSFSVFEIDNFLLCSHTARTRRPVASVRDAVNGSNKYNFYRNHKVWGEQAQCCFCCGCPWSPHMTRGDYLFIIIFIHIILPNTVADVQDVTRPHAHIPLLVGRCVVTNLPLDPKSSFIGFQAKSFSLDPDCVSFFYAVSSCAEGGHRTNTPEGVWWNPIPGRTL